MGGPKASSAIRTISIARTTPAQNPRGFNSNNCLFSDNAIPLSRSAGILPAVPRTCPERSQLLDILKVPENAPQGQCKPLKEQGLAPNGEYRTPNGIHRMGSIEWDSYQGIASAMP